MPSQNVGSVYTQVGEDRQHRFDPLAAPDGADHAESYTKNSTDNKGQYPQVQG
jgi:hypothetical protein